MWFSLAKLMWSGNEYCFQIMLQILRQQEVN